MPNEKLGRNSSQNVSLLHDEARIPPDELNDLWSEASFAFDANVLLNCYRYSASTTDELFRVLGQFKEQLWLPHQAALEYERNRESTANSIYKPFETVKESLRKSVRPLRDVLQKYSAIDALLKPVDDSLTRTVEAVEAARAALANELPADSLHLRICELFTGKTGKRYETTRLLQIYEEAERRFSFRIPPGYEDVGEKQAPEKYGDVVLWFQVLDHAVSTKRPIIFITDDRKQDWFAGTRGNRTGPRPELLREVWDTAGVRGHIYEVDAFLKAAGNIAKVRVSDKAIGEIREVGTVASETPTVWPEVLANAGHVVAEMIATNYAEQIRARVAKSDPSILKEFWKTRSKSELDLLQELFSGESIKAIASRRGVPTSETLAELMDLYQSFIDFYAGKGGTKRK